MINEQECMNRILEQVPEFNERWIEHLKYWHGQQVGLSMDMAAFSDFANVLITARETTTLSRIFGVIEDLLKVGCENV